MWSANLRVTYVGRGSKRISIFSPILLFWLLRCFLHLLFPVFRSFLFPYLFPFSSVLSFFLFIILFITSNLIYLHFCHICYSKCNNIAYILTISISSICIFHFPFSFFSLFSPPPPSSPSHSACFNVFYFLLFVFLFLISLYFVCFCFCFVALFLPPLIVFNIFFFLTCYLFDRSLFLLVLQTADLENVSESPFFEKLYNFYCLGSGSKSGWG